MGLIGYARVSTVEGRQILARQLDALQAAGCERVFEEHGSGADPDRPTLAACLDHLRKSDILAVLDLDRLGRRAAELVALIDDLESRGIGFKALNSPMGYHHAGGTRLPADPGRLRRDGAQHHPPARARGHEGGVRPRPPGGAPPNHDPRQAALRPAPHGGPDALDPGHLDDMPSSTLYHYLHADGTLKDPGRRLLRAPAERQVGPELGASAPPGSSAAPSRPAAPAAPASATPRPPPDGTEDVGVVRGGRRSEQTVKFGRGRLQPSVSTTAFPRRLG